MGATRARLQIHKPAGRCPAGAILVLHRARAAVPVLPPDPLEVVHLEQEEGDDPEENLGARHVLHRIGAVQGLARAGWPKLSASRSYEIRVGAERPRKGTAPPRTCRPYSAPPRRRP